MKERYATKHRIYGTLISVALLAAGCTAEDEPKAEDPNACLNEIDGKGDLEITDSTLTPINPDASKDFVQTYAIEITNRSKTGTAVMAGLMAETVDSDGNLVGSTGATGRVEFLAPGKSQYFTGASFQPSDKRPSDVEVTTPRPLLDEGWNRPATYWMPDKDVNYPDKLQASNVSLSDGGKLEFDVNNDSERHFKEVEALILLRDADRKVIGGRETVRAEVAKNGHGDYDWPDIEVPPGQSTASMTPFPDGLPEAADLSKTEVQLRAPYDFTKIDPDCKFDLSKE